MLFFIVLFLKLLLFAAHRLHQTIAAHLYYLHQSNQQQNGYYHHVRLEALIAKADGQSPSPPPPMTPAMEV